MTFKAKRAGTKNAHVVIVLDASSSMISCWSETIQGVNLFLDKQKTSEIPTEVSLYTFNGFTTRCVLNKVPAEEAPKLTKENYSPNGMTNLLDAIGTVINTTNDQLNATKKEFRPSVEIMIVTDGEENRSRQFSVSQIREMKQACESKDWTFTFLGANIDAFQESAKLGFGVQNTYQYDTSSILNTMSVMTKRTDEVKLARSVGASASQVYAQTELTSADRDQLTK